MLGEDFSDLPVDDMRVVIEETKFYYTAKDGLNLFGSDEFKKNLNTVIRVCKTIETIDKEPSIEFNSDNANLIFSTKYMQLLNEKIYVDPVPKFSKPIVPNPNNPPSVLVPLNK